MIIIIIVSPFFSQRKDKTNGGKIYGSLIGEEKQTAQNFHYFFQNRYDNFSKYRHAGQ